MMPHKRPSIAQIAHLKTKLEEFGHDAFYVGWECASIKHGAKGTDISDDTANIISSEEYLNLK